MGPGCRASSRSAVSPARFSLCSPVGRWMPWRTARPLAGAAAVFQADCPASRAFTLLWGEAGANPAVSPSLSLSTCRLGTHPLSASVHLSTVYQVLGSLWSRVQPLKAWDQTPPGPSKLCTLGQVTQTRCFSGPSCQAGLVTVPTSPGCCKHTVPVHSNPHPA